MSDFEPRIIGFCCSNCAAAAATVAEKMALTLPENVHIVQLACTGRLDTLHILKAFEAGADGVYVAGCQPDSCQFKRGIERAEKKAELVKKTLKDIGIEPERVAVYNMSAGKGNLYVDAARDMVEKIRALGPSPVGKA